MEEPTEEKKDLLMSLAEKTDYIPRGLISGKTDLASGLENLVGKLLQSDERVWGQLLLSAHGDFPEAGFHRLKKVSPFRDKVLLETDYGIGFVSLKGEFQDLIDKTIKLDRNMKIYDGDKYMIVLSANALKDAKIVWLKCGLSSVKEPRKAGKK